jgi:hypothetical protein
MSRLIKLMLPAALIGILLTGRMFRAASAEEDLDAEKIAVASGVKTTTTPDGVVRIAWARSEVPVKVDCMPLKPFEGLGSWAAFSPMPHGAMVMGDTVVFQDEVTPAMDAAFAAGLAERDVGQTRASEIGEDGGPVFIAARLRPGGAFGKSRPGPIFAICPRDSEVAVQRTDTMGAAFR